jgi:cyclohexa-1,5-dienecarbonyl-CoA hydratase
MAKVRFEKSDHFYRITLADPPLNILDIEMLGELRAALREVKNDRPMLVIDADGEKAFSAGASVQDHMGDRIDAMLSLFHECFRILDRVEVVTIALVRGAALGGGCELALACDFVLASSNAKFGQPEIKLGVFPPVAAFQLARQLPPRKGLELLLLGESIDAKEASALGIVNAVFDAASFVPDAEAWMSRFTRLSASSLRFAKKAFRISAHADFQERLTETERLYLDELMKSGDAVEGLTAFLEKRAPRYAR